MDTAVVEARPAPPCGPSGPWPYQLFQLSLAATHKLANNWLHKMSYTQMKILDFYQTIIVDSLLKQPVCKVP